MTCASGCMGFSSRHLATCTVTVWVSLHVSWRLVPVTVWVSLHVSWRLVPVTVWVSPHVSCRLVPVTVWVSLHVSWRLVPVTVWVSLHVSCNLCKPRSQTKASQTKSCTGPNPTKRKRTMHFLEIIDSHVINMCSEIHANSGPEF